MVVDAQGECLRHSHLNRLDPFWMVPTRQTRTAGWGEEPERIFAQSLVGPTRASFAAMRE